jgi:hypothetical protein
MVKCVGCHYLQREILKWATPGPRLPTVVYDCFLGRLPYSTTLGGLFRPYYRILQASEKCQEQPTSRCVVCLKTSELKTYGQDNFVSICKEHDKAWGKWLSEHPDRSAYLAPRGRVIKANWVDVFREFIEDMRKETPALP